MNDEWLRGAERACNDAVEADHGALNFDQLLAVAAVHAQIATAHALRDIRDLIVLGEPPADG